MPDHRLQQTRATLPEGYQFGDGKWTPKQVAAAREVERRTAGHAMLKFRLGEYVRVTFAQPVSRSRDCSKPPSTERF